MKTTTVADFVTLSSLARVSVERERMAGVAGELRRALIAGRRRDDDAALSALDRVDVAR